MTRGSLRTRMVLLSALVTLVALGLAGWTMAGVLGRVVTGGVDQRLDAQLAVLASAVRDDGSVDRARLAARQGALAAGPGWRWRIEAPRETVGDADFPALHLPLPGPAEIAPAALPTPLDGEDAKGRVHARRLVLASSAGPVTLTAAAPGRVIGRPVRDALVPLASVIVALAVIFAAAAWVQLRLALRPLAALVGQIGAIRRGERAAVDEDQPAELRPLATELNALAAANAATLAAARQSAANLAHALKTPVATLALTVAPNTPEAAQVRRIEGVIRHTLARARAVAVNRRASTEIAPVAADVAGVLRTLYPAITPRLEIGAGVRIAMDAHDLAEILGNLLDNAARHARSTVVLTAAAADGTVLTIDDDGPGIAPERREQVLQPGVRLDEGPAGDGFGLAIVRDLVTLYGGTMALEQSPLGGLCVRLTCPDGATA
ncbi:Signal transduction histidine kinase [Sphingomonas sp. NFR04]|uniref:sensor histidine kinase n=1 Tax=Sphingomonas sp. NFR04 TaxID=1566283 RepID=UPI0008E980F2|nr:sensor histidine kinase [Sphingomonas sp. NFR04]SFK33485.1 Signal transduction histidine kinase [Sphingomonas sp. NFR04]